MAKTSDFGRGTGEAHGNVLLDIGKTLNTIQRDKKETEVSEQEE